MEVDHAINLHDLARRFFGMKLTERREVARSAGLDPTPCLHCSEFERAKGALLQAQHEGKVAALDRAIRDLNG